MNGLKRIGRHWLLVPALLAVASCASLLGTDPLQVNLAGVEPLPGEGMEMRMAVKLRIPGDNGGKWQYLSFTSRRVISLAGNRCHCHDNYANRCPHYQS